MKKEEMLEILKGLQNLLEITEVLKYSKDKVDCNCSDDEDDSDDEETALIEEYEQEYKNILTWCFGELKSTSVAKDSIIKKWSKHHPELPPLFIPLQVDNNTAYLIFLLQILPHWIEHKKKINTKL